MKFTLTINLDNAAMDTPYELGKALRKVIRDLPEEDLEECSDTIRDHNGNRVGDWSISDDE